MWARDLVLEERVKNNGMLGRPMGVGLKAVGQTRLVCMTILRSGLGNLFKSQKVDVMHGLVCALESTRVSGSPLGGFRPMIVFHMPLYTHPMIVFHMSLRFSHPL